MLKTVGVTLAIVGSALVSSNDAYAYASIKATFSCSSGQACVANVAEYPNDYQGFITQGTCTWVSRLTVTRVDFEVYGTSPAETYWLMPHVVSDDENKAKGFYKLFSNLGNGGARYVASDTYRNRLRATVRTSGIGSISGTCYFGMTPVN